MQNDFINTFQETRADHRVEGRVPHATGARWMEEGGPRVPHTSNKVFLKLFCKSQFLHNFVNLFLIIVIVKDKLTDLWRCRLCKTTSKTHSVRYNLARGRGGGRCGRFYLTEYVYGLVSESQPPHKIVNLLFAITNYRLGRARGYWRS